MKVFCYLFLGEDYNYSLISEHFYIFLFIILVFDSPDQSLSSLVLSPWDSIKTVALSAVSTISQTQHPLMGSLLSACFIPFLLYSCS